MGKPPSRCPLSMPPLPTGPPQAFHDNTKLDCEERSDAYPSEACRSKEKPEKKSFFETDVSI